MLHVDHLSYRYPGSIEPVLNNLSFTLHKGEFVSLIGASGSGKSTLLKVLSGLMEPDKGRLLFNDGEKGRLGKVALMPQKDLLLPWRTVLENVLLPVEITDKNKIVEQEKAVSWLKDFGLEEVAHEYPSRLSGGMKQRVAFLRTMMTGCELLLLDEPFGALDAMRKQEMQIWLLSIWERLGKTVFFITHDIEEAVLLSDRVFILRHSEIEEVSISLQRPREHKFIYERSFIEYRKLLNEKIREGRD